jgi:protein gp37
MAEKSAIEWTDATWNPVTGCDRVSEGCDHCYALTLAARLKAMGNRRYQHDGDPRTSGPGFGLSLHLDQVDLPLRWKRPRTVFVNSMSDLFHDRVPDAFISHVFEVMGSAQQHVFQVLTKRPGRMASLLTRWTKGLAAGEDESLPPVTEPFGWPFPNVWLGTSVETQKWANVRIPQLLRTPAALRFLSVEPLLGPVDLGCYIGRERPTIDWVIVGGESGPEHRPVDPAWVASLRDQCVAADVPFFFKQWGGRTPKAGGRELDGRVWDEFPGVQGGSSH